MMHLPWLLCTVTSPLFCIQFKNQLVLTSAQSNTAVCQVSDIKRANGLLSDTGMFAKDTLLIPTQAMAIG